MADAGYEKTEEILERIERQLKREYSRANKEVQEKLDEYFKQFAEGDKKMRRKVLKGAITKQKYQQWRVGKIAVGKRWSSLKQVLAEDYYNVNQIAKSTVRGYLPEVYAINHGFETYDIGRKTGADMSYTMYSIETVERLWRENPKLLPDPTPGSKTAKMLARNKDLRWNRQKLQSELTQGIIQGESNPKLARRFRRVTDMNYHASLRNARTAVTGAQNAGRIDSMRRAVAMGIPLVKTWSAVGDERTRDSHAFIDGETVPVDEPFSNGLMYPGDPGGAPSEVWNCRCTLISQVEGFEHYGDRVASSDDRSFDEWMRDEGRQSR